MPARPEVPAALRTWFVIHFVADLAFALPMYLAPELTLSLFGWRAIDPAATRLVAAALFGIGIQSLLGRNEGPEAYRAMLTLKVIWSSTATVGLAWSVLSGRTAPATWLFVAIFAGFCAVWTYWRVRLPAWTAAGAPAAVTHGPARNLA